MKFISTAFVLLAFSHAAVVAAPQKNNPNNSQCDTATKTVTVTARGDAVTKTVTVDASATSRGRNKNTGGNEGTNDNGDNKGKNNNNGGGKKGNNNNNGGGKKGNNNNNNGGGNKGNNNNNGGKNNTGANKGQNNNNNGGKNSTGDLQTSLQLDPSVIGANLAQNGIAGGEPGQAPSLTSTNNFINFCLGKTITNGVQNTAGSCNPVPQGDIPAKTSMPSSKFTSPQNFATIQPNTAFTVSMAIQNMVTGDFVNAKTNYFAAPQQLKNGLIVGHSHIVIQLLDSLTQTAPADPQVFAFFLGLNAAAQGGVLTASVAKGLPPGVYRIASINTSGNHGPVLVPVAQHGSLDDMIYITVANNATAAATDSPAATNSAVAATSAAATASTAPARGGKAASSAAPAVPSSSAAAPAKGGQTKAAPAPAANGATATNAAPAAPAKQGGKGRRFYLARTIA